MSPLPLVLCVIRNLTPIAYRYMPSASQSAHKTLKLDILGGFCVPDVVYVDD